MRAKPSRGRPCSQQTFEVLDYDLDATLASGQVFRWKQIDGRWEGVVGRHWTRLTKTPRGIVANTFEEVTDWSWLSDYLQTGVQLAPILATFPEDRALRDAMSYCQGLRLLRQDPWECLASFLLSSSKQIVQIQQIVALLCERWGEEIPAPPDRSRAFAFPSADRIAGCSERELRNCKMGFRAPYLKATATMIADGVINLRTLADAPVEQARDTLMKLPGVGRKIADCVLLFAYGYSAVFPIDVWVARSLREDYFSGREMKLDRLIEFAAEHFGPNAGYAQQYLFHRKRSAALTLRTAV